MNETGDFQVPKGSVAVGRRVRLPRGAEEPIRVYRTGVEQSRGIDYTIEDGHVVFRTPILKEEKLSGIRWAALFVGVVGTYRKHETVDLEYRLGGQVKLAGDVAIVADPEFPDAHRASRDAPDV